MKWWPFPWPHRNRNTGESVAALESAERNLREVQERWPEVRAVSEQLRHQRRVNSLAKAITDALGAPHHDG